MCKLQETGQIIFMSWKSYVYISDIVILFYQATTQKNILISTVLESKLYAQKCYYYVFPEQTNFVFHLKLDQIIIYNKTGNTDQSQHFFLQSKSQQKLYIYNLIDMKPISVIYLHNIWIIPRTFVRLQTSPLGSTSACSPQKFRKLTINKKQMYSIMSLGHIKIIKKLILVWWQIESIPCIYYFKKFVLKFCPQHLQIKAW